MRIWLIETSDFLPLVDDGNRLYRAGMLANALVHAGHEVLWWSSTFNHQLREQRYKNSTTIYVKKGYRLRLLFGPGYNRSISLQRWIHNRNVAREFKKETFDNAIDGLPDLIYSCFPTIEICEQAVNFGLRNDIPVIVDIRELLPDNYLAVFPRFLRPLVRAALHAEFLRAKYVLKNATAITGSSEAYVNWGLNFVKRKPTSNDKWFPLGTSAPTSKLSCLNNIDSLSLPYDLVFDPDKLLITFVGTFTKLFDFNTIFETARDLMITGDRSVQFLLVGDGDHFPALKETCGQLDNVHLTGWCKKSLVDKILSKSSIGIAPYSFSFTPTLPNKPLEYMAAGLPLLSSLGGELKQIIDKEGIGLQYKASDSGNLKNKIQWFLSHPEERQAMGRRARRLFKKKYNADIVYANLVEHLNKLVCDGVSNK